LPIQTLVDEAVGSGALYVGQQWLQPGQRVLLHTHPVEEVLTFLTGQGEATLGEQIITFAAETTLHIPAGIVHGFRNTGRDELRLLVIFPTPHFAETTIVEPEP
jgi:quercetin dioxygenase-like cupin family protein